MVVSSEPRKRERKNSVLVLSYRNEFIEKNETKRTARYKNVFIHAADSKL